MLHRGEDLGDHQNLAGPTESNGMVHVARWHRCGLTMPCPPAATRLCKSHDVSDLSFLVWETNLTAPVVLIFQPEMLFFRKQEVTLGAACQFSFFCTLSILVLCCWALTALAISSEFKTEELHRGDAGGAPCSPSKEPRDAGIPQDLQQVPLASLDGGVLSMRLHFKAAVQRSVRF